MPTVCFRWLPSALRSRNYRLFFMGQTLSMVGNWMNVVTTSWLVYHLTSSPLWLGLVGFGGQLPVFLLAPIAGVIVDRCSCRRLLLVTQGLGLIQSLGMAILTMTHVISVSHLLLFSVAQGCINAFDMTTRQSFVVEMLDQPEQLSSGIGLNSSLISAARLVGPALAGILIAAAGAGWCYVLDVVSYGPMVAALMAMRIRPTPLATLESLTQKAKSPLRKLREGIGYTYRHASIRTILLVLTAFSILHISYLALGPVFATQILQGGPTTLGFLLSASGAGALMAGLLMSVRQSPLGLERMITVAPFLTGVGLLAYGFSTKVELSVLILVMVGFSFVLHIASSNTLLQTLVDPDKRGRVMSLYTMAFVGTTPFGYLLAGVLANLLGAAHTVMVTGVLCLFISGLTLPYIPRIRIALLDVLRVKMPTLVEASVKLR